ncbi:GNAT family N-acetyltransferase [Effusibacillus consociatus]|uniref:GNAT family N-acetyltransferase n=1 Tax=Effusibacillus consociatus TaxID=1117041 RepID=A0ABV9Q2X9_9BACL
MSQPAEKLKQVSSLSVKIAKSAAEIEKALRLRYKVFVEEARNINLFNEAGIERDEYDAYCDHLIVEDLESGQVVGTYRLLPGDRASLNLGFYSETEFDLSGFQEYKPFTLELGRSCIAEEYRGSRAIQMLWEGIADYITEHGHKYLIGCASVEMKNLLELNELYSMLKAKGVITDRFGIRPLETHRIEGLQSIEIDADDKTVFRKLPPLMKGYQW